MPDEQMERLKDLVDTELGKTESRLMAHIDSIEQKLHDLQQQTSSVQTHVDARTNDIQSEFQRVRYAIEQLGSRSH